MRTAIVVIVLIAAAVVFIADTTLRALAEHERRKRLSDLRPKDPEE